MFWVRSDLDSGKKIRVFNLGGGVFWIRSDLDSGKKIRVFNFWGRGGGVFWVRSDLDSRKNFNFGGGGSVLGKVRLGGCSGTEFQNRGVIENLVKNFWKPSLLVHHR